jgi:hypothetical protein
MSCSSVRRGCARIDEKMETVVAFHVGVDVAALERPPDGVISDLELSEARPADHRSAASAASGSSSSRQRNRSRNRSAVIGGTTILRFERICTAPSAARRLNASRTGVWLTAELEREAPG